MMNHDLCFIRRYDYPLTCWCSSTFWVWTVHVHVCRNILFLCFLLYIYIERYSALEECRQASLFWWWQMQLHVSSGISLPKCFLRNIYSSFVYQGTEVVIVCLLFTTDKNKDHAFGKSTCVMCMGDSCAYTNTCGAASQVLHISWVTL